MKAFWILPILALAAGCGRRGGGDINVDEVQSRADEVEEHLRAMQTALEKKDLDDAQDEYEEASEIMEDNAAELAAYPEADLLKRKIARATVELCYSQVDIRLQGFFDAIRAKQPKDAKSRLAGAQKELGRCQDTIKAREDFAALKMNLESGPQALSDLEKELLLARQAKQIGEIKDDLLPRLQKLKGQIASLDQNPNQRELALEADKALAGLREELAGHEEWKAHADWLALTTSLAGDLTEIDAKRTVLVRKGRILWIVEGVLPQAALAAQGAVGTQDLTKAIPLCTQAQDAYRQCLSTLQEVLKEEAGLSKFSFSWSRGTKTVAWLKDHCVNNLQIVERLAAKLAKKKGLPPPKSTPKPPPAAEPKPAPKVAPKGAAPAPKKKGRIQRW